MSSFVQTISNGPSPKLYWLLLYWAMIHLLWFISCKVMFFLCYYFSRVSLTPPPLPHIWKNIWSLLLLREHTICNLSSIKFANGSKLFVVIAQLYQVSANIWPSQRQAKNVSSGAYFVLSKREAMCLFDWIRLTNYHRWFLSTPTLSGRGQDIAQIPYYLSVIFNELNFAVT